MSEVKRFCPHCGAKLRDDAQYCQQCGYKVPMVSPDDRLSSNRTHQEANDQGRSFMHENLKMVYERSAVAHFLQRNKTIIDPMVAWLPWILFVFLAIGLLIGIDEITYIAFVLLMVDIGVQIHKNKALLKKSFLGKWVGNAQYASGKEQILAEIKNNQANSEYGRGKETGKTSYVAHYTMRIREFLTMLTLCVVVGSIYFGDFVTAGVSFWNKRGGIDLSALLSTGGYLDGDLNQLKIVLTILPVLGLLFIVLPNLFLKMIGLLAVFATDGLIGYIIYTIDQYMNDGNQSVLMSFQFGPSAIVMGVAAAIATLFAISCLFSSSVRH
ncbi:zinc ribbon domain-containing protein [Lentilactobacillus hilgardii]|jgi:ribosomal protein S27AE|uniref:zinc ribbon domain-containing protein n=1 Tax=Lentilactobacillus hilgardii TaxID=1588 RepID=UPI0021C30F4F|nr:zinc ribbon domain-containing protein [Lentilactobacillus hilgardii]MCP9333114.1 zinc ribbon domain-containing protein [Lentilactobacillus hilgardii]MCP9349723.1 zinc ribbon domain-containing protein [Lentilactobacillus hilgardii]MCP9352637.1 zinc ribbon domain-containing protein [Lentilactobacillus hilgardii]